MITVDSNEKVELFKTQSDARTALTHDNRDDGTSYDFRVECDDGTVYKFERKTISDFVGTWRKGRLARQLSEVDGLIIEFDGSHTHGSETFFVNSLKHLANVGSSMWLIPTTGPWETMDVLRYIEGKGSDIEVKENRVTHSAIPTRWDLLDTLPRINVERMVNKPRTVGHELEDIIDWEGLVDALNLQEWTEVERLGPKTIENIKKELLNE